MVFEYSPKKRVWYFILTCFSLCLLSFNVFASQIEVLHQGDNLMIRHGQDSGNFTWSINGEDYILNFANGLTNLPLDLSEFDSGKLLFIKNQDRHAKLMHVIRSSDGYRVKHIPLWLSLVPPLIAISLALLLKEVIISLFCGIWAGAFIACGMSFSALFSSFLRVVEKYVISALADPDHMSVIVFSLLIGGMVAIISKNGGMAGVVQALSKYAKTRKSSQFITWVLGVAIFFDDYANTLIVGNTMRSVTDKMKVSREKLAYIVDSTAAPVAAVAFITTWIGAELGYIDDGMHAIQGHDFNTTPYAIFVQSLKYSFYPVFTLCFILFIIKSGKDYGPMFAAEERAIKTGRVSSAKTIDDDEPNMEDLSPVKNAKLHWSNAVFPVLTVIFITIFGLWQTGMSATKSDLITAGLLDYGSSNSAAWSILNEQGGLLRKLGIIVGNANSYTALLWSSLSGVFVAILMTTSKRIIKLFDTMHHMVTGFKTMVPAVIILTMAWSLAICTKELHTADYLTGLMEGNISPVFMPVITFILAALIAFSTGSSWSTMAILYPIAIPTTWAVAQASGLDAAHSYEILLNVISVVLAASVLGDHCSPISDTTILSSLASDCNHMDHVRSQMPYALTVGLVSLVAGGIAAWTGGGWLICGIIFLVGLATLYLIVQKFGKSLSQSD